MEWCSLLHYDSTPVLNSYSNSNPNSNPISYSDSLTLTLYHQLPVCSVGSTSTRRKQERNMAKKGTVENGI